jgi:predicted acylesterase/phospholipase RssA
MLLLIVSLIPLTLAAHNSTKCYALASSGGGNNGAWEAGVVYGFAHQGDPSDYYWDSVTGVSAGAINSVLNCAWAPDDVVNFSEALSDLWAEMTTADLYVPWPGGFKEGITD